MEKANKYGMTFRPKFRSLQVIHGKDGLSAYEIAVKKGFKGSEAEWLESLKGKNGTDGYTPVKGVDYVDGKDGHTPIKGTDYYTAAEKAEIVDDVLIKIRGDLDTISALVGGAE